jgi:hypothetical protein
MAQNIILKRSGLAGKVPDTGSLNLGEVAINTYDGKVFFKRSGSVESIQEILTTNSTITGSLSMNGTGSFASLQVNNTLTVNHGTTIISGSQLVTDELTVLGAINARQFNISVISSSVLFQSGSTKFGDTQDDTHQFTGSINVTGSISASTFTGVGNLTEFSSSLSNRIISASAGGNNTFDFNLEPSVAGQVGFIEDISSNTQVVAQTDSVQLVIASTTYLSMSANTMNITTGSITANYMHLAKYINNSGDLDFNV